MDFGATNKYMVPVIVLIIMWILLTLLVFVYCLANKYLNKQQKEGLTLEQKVVLDYSESEDEYIPKHMEKVFLLAKMKENLEKDNKRSKPYSAFINPSVRDLTDLKSSSMMSLNRLEANSASSLDTLSRCSLDNLLDVATNVTCDEHVVGDDEIHVKLKDSGFYTSAAMEVSYDGDNNVLNLIITNLKDLVSPASGGPHYIQLQAKLIVNHKDKIKKLPQKSSNKFILVTSIDVLPKAFHFNNITEKILQIGTLKIKLYGKRSGIRGLSLTDCCLGQSHIFVGDLEFYDNSDVIYVTRYFLPIGDKFDG